MYPRRNANRQLRASGCGLQAEAQRLACQHRPQVPQRRWSLVAHNEAPNRFYNEIFILTPLVPRLI